MLNISCKFIVWLEQEENGDRFWWFKTIKFGHLDIWGDFGKSVNGQARMPASGERTDWLLQPRWLGKVTIHLRAKENALAAREIESALERSVVNKNKWLGTLDEPIKTNGVSYLRECVQDYFVDFINADDMTSAESVVDAAIRLYPKDAVFLADKGTICYYSNDLNGALKWYLASRENAPDDMLVADNIARIYDKLGDKQNAIKYYRIVAESGDENYAESASARLKNLTAR